MTGKVYSLAAPESDPQVPGKVVNKTCLVSFVTLKKWAFPFSAITKIAHGPTSLVIYTDGSIPKVKQEIHLVFNSEKENDEV